MVKRILTGAGFIENETFRETRFLSPPKSTYAVFMDSYTSGGADTVVLVKRHSVTIELYEYAPDPTAEAKIEARLNEYYPRMSGEWNKEPRYWLESEQLYQVVYTFDYIEK
jgi:hypothetical protein